MKLKTKYHVYCLECSNDFLTYRDTHAKKNNNRPQCGKCHGRFTTKLYTFNQEQSIMNLPKKGLKK